MANHHGQAEFLLKFLVVGNAGVGKTCILHQYVHNGFKTDSQHTIGAELGSRMIILKDKQEDQKNTTDHPTTEETIGRPIKLQIWDTAGQERFRSVTRSYYRGACGALLVYDITDRSTFTSVSGWLDDAQNLASKHIVIILCGNKSDLKNERQVTTEEAQQFADENNMFFFETSAKEGTNIEDAFYKCTESVIKKVDDMTINLNEPGTGILRYGTPVSPSKKSGTKNGPDMTSGGAQFDAKVDLLKREVDEAFNKFKGGNCC